MLVGQVFSARWPSFSRQNSNLMTWEIGFFVVSHHLMSAPRTGHYAQAAAAADAKAAQQAAAEAAPLLEADEVSVKVSQAVPEATPEDEPVALAVAVQLLASVTVTL